MQVGAVLTVDLRQHASGVSRRARLRRWFGTPRWSSPLAAAALVLAMVGAGVVAYLPFTWTPTVVPAAAPAEVFSADRAMNDLRAVASRPRSMGTAEHEATIGTIRARLTELGVESEVVEEIVARPGFGQVFAARTRNVIARIPGTDSTGAVALLSHFDSLPTSPNANDGGLGVATVPHPVVALALNDIALGVSPDLGMSMGGTSVAGVSFSQIGDSSGYHTDLDNPDRVALGSLQHSGETALALAQRFGAADLAAAPAQDGLVAVNTVPGRVLAYPAGWAVPLALLVVALLGGALVVGKLRARITVALIISTVLTPEVHFARNPYGAGWRMLALGALALATVAGVFLGAGRLLRTRPRRTAITAGPLVVLALLAVLTAVALPALSHVFLLPTLGGAALLAATVLRSADAARPWALALGLAVVGALVAWVTVPLVYLIGSGTSVSLPAFASIIAGCTALLAGALVPHIHYLAGVVRPWAVPLGLLVAAGAFIVGGLPAYGPERPRPDHMPGELVAAAVDGQALVVDAAAPVRRLPIAVYNPGPSGIEVTIASVAPSSLDPVSDPADRHRRTACAGAGHPTVRPRNAADSPRSGADATAAGADPQRHER